MEIHISQLFPTWYESFAVVTGFFSVGLLLATKWPKLQYLNWIIGIVSCAVYVYVFYDYKLYANSSLQILFVVLSVMGAWKWRGQFFGQASVPELPVTRLEITSLITYIQMGLAIFILTYAVLIHTDAVNPIADAGVFALSLIGIYLQTKKVLENWYFWIAVDIIGIPLYLSQDLGATALLYIVFLVMSIIGLITWRREVHNGQGSTIVGVNRDGLSHA